MLGLEGVYTACQETEFSDGPSRGSMESEVQLLARSREEYRLTVWNQCSIDDNCSNEQERGKKSSTKDKSHKK